MGFLNSFITAALCLTMAAAPTQQQPATGPTGTPQAGQTSGTTAGTRASDTARRDATPHAAPALATKARQADAPQSEKAAGPQDDTGTCTPVAPQTWGTPADDAAVNKVPDRDPAPIQWEIGSDCTLTLHHGTSPDRKNTDPLPWGQYAGGPITKIRIDGNVTLYSTDQDLTFMFLGYITALHEMQVDGTLHLAGKAAHQLFYSAYKLADFTGVGLKGFETSQATDMTMMFSGCEELKSLDLSSFDTRNVTTLAAMFSASVKLQSLDLSSFDTRNVTDMSIMFWGCDLTSLDLSNFDTRNVTTMDGMFAYNHHLKSLDLSNFDTGNVIDMAAMFCSCTGLTSLNISHFDTRRLVGSTWIWSMLGTDPALRELWLGPYTYLADTDTDTTALESTWGPGFAYDVWLELPATGPHIPVSDLRARTSLTSPRTPQGHYIIPSLTLTVDYDNGQADHTETTVTDTSKTAGSQTVALGPRPTPAGKVFDGWRLTTSDPEHVTLHGDTVSWTAKAYDPDARITATWRTPAAQPGHNQTPGQPNNRNRDPNRPADPATAGKDPDALALTGTTATQALTLLAALLTLATTLLATTKRHTHRHTRTHTR
jgi:surface protein